LEMGEVIVRFNNRELVDAALSVLKISKKDSLIFMRTLDKRDKIGDDKVVESLRKDGFDSDILRAYSKLMDDSSGAYIEKMQGLLSGLGVQKMEFDKYLMRGLDYYTGLVFEFGIAGRPEFGSIGGGGRYDGLIGQNSGTDIPAVGGSIGLDRLFAALEEMNVIAPQTAAEVMVFNLDEKLTAEYLNMATNLRNAGIDAEFYYETAKLDKQFKYAETKNTKLAIIMGSDEAAARKVNIKDMEDKKQVTVDLDNLVTEVKSMLW
ncbi:MAG TPA: HisS family protein, partial [Coxiellaceae bacterium]|nr:HisS family protein [Coxiellaceae bacterium]